MARKFEPPTRTEEQRTRLTERNPRLRCGLCSLHTNKNETGHKGFTCIIPVTTMQDYWVGWYFTSTVPTVSLQSLPPFLRSHSLDPLALPKHLLKGPANLRDHIRRDHPSPLLQERPATSRTGHHTAAYSRQKRDPRRRDRPVP
jgi:hypothetical protein